MRDQNAIGHGPSVAHPEPSSGTRDPERAAGFPAEPPQSGTEPDGTRPAVIGVQALLIFGVAAALRAAGLGEGALHDELFNFLAAEGLLHRGEMTLVPGGEPYTRGSFFTHVVAAFLGAFGDSLTVGRIPALLAGSLLAAATFVWLRAVGERAAGWIAGLLIAVDPILIQLSQVVRFYSFQHLFFLLGVIGVYTASVRVRTSRRALPFAAATVAAFAVALHLQSVTLIGVGGVLVFVALDAARAYGGRRSRRAGRRWVIGGAVALVAAGLLAWIQRDHIAALIEMAGFVDIWAADDAGNLRYYYVTMYDGYAPLWALFPLLALYAFVHRSRLAALSATVFAVGFVVHSLLPWKADRYLSYLLPLFFIVASVGVVHALPHLHTLVRDLCRTIARRLPGAPRVARPASLAILVGLIGFASASNRAFLDTAKLVTREHAFAFPGMGPRDGTLSWERFSERIRPVLDSVDVVVSSDQLKALHYLGRVDFVVSPSLLYTTDGWQPEFWHDPQSNARAVRRADSMAAIMDCHASGLYVAQRMSVHTGVTGRAAPTEYVAAHAEPVALPDKWGMVAYVWQTDSIADADGARCAGVRAPGTSSGGSSDG